ncbi:MAG: bis(5'-nucleosyl)-tetraphosphatase (symmetrical) [Limisphaerales bacterium]
MATYAIGDLQGCYKEFQALLTKLEFCAGDKLWLLGDLINRGAESLATLQSVVEMSDQCEVVLGNHDLHFLAIYYGGHAPGANDTFDEILGHKDVDAYAAWLCEQKMTHRDRQLGYFMSHAGLPPIWSPKKAVKLGREVEAVLQNRHDRVSKKQFFKELYGNEPRLWRDDLKGMPRLKLITNYLTRMRLIDAEGALEFEHKGALTDAPDGWYPWYELSDLAEWSGKVLFGHWAALDGETGKNDIIALDTGCVWGRKLTALCLETGVYTSVPAMG